MIVKLSVWFRNLMAPCAYGVSQVRRVTNASASAATANRRGGAVTSSTSSTTSPWVRPVSTARSTPPTATGTTASPPTASSAGLSSSIDSCLGPPFRFVSSKKKESVQNVRFQNYPRRQLLLPLPVIHSFRNHWTWRNWGCGYAVVGLPRWRSDRGLEEPLARRGFQHPLARPLHERHAVHGRCAHGHAVPRHLGFYFPLPIHSGQCWNPLLALSHGYFFDYESLIRAFKCLSNKMGVITIKLNRYSEKWKISFV